VRFASFDQPLLPITPPGDEPPGYFTKSIGLLFCRKIEFANDII
jgi:hypothetical protein